MVVVTLRGPLLVMVAAGPVMVSTTPTTTTIAAHIGPTIVRRPFRTNLTGVKTHIEVLAGAAVVIARGIVA